MVAKVQTQAGPNPFWKSKPLLVGLSAAILIGAVFFGKDLFRTNPYPGVPKKAVALFDKGNEALAQDSVEKALNLFYKAIELDPSFADAQARIAEGYFVAALKHRASRNSKMADAMFEQSDTYVKKAFSLDPDNGYAHYVVGLTRNDKQDLEEAVRELEKAEAKGVTTFELHTILGFLYNDKSETAKSVEQYQKALERRPDDIKTLFNLGELYFWLGNYSKSVKYYGELLKYYKPDNSNNSNNGTYRANYAAAIWKDGDEAKAKELFNQLLTADEGKNWRNYNSVAWALIDKDIDYAWGIKIALAASELKTNMESSDILGWGYYKNKDYVNAVRYLNRSMEMQPSEEVRRRLNLAREKLEESTKK
jgi:tetratricopeptide (TPR) repeat protein